MHYDADLGWDRFALGRPLPHLDPDEKGKSSGRTSLRASAHLAVEDLDEDHPTKEKEALAVGAEGALLRDETTCELSGIPTTYRFRHC